MDDHYKGMDSIQRTKKQNSIPTQSETRFINVHFTDMSFPEAIEALHRYFEVINNPVAVILVKAIFIIVVHVPLEVKAAIKKKNPGFIKEFDHESLLNDLPQVVFRDLNKNVFVVQNGQENILKQLLQLGRSCIHIHVEVDAATKQMSPINSRFSDNFNPTQDVMKMVWPGKPTVHLSEDDDIYLCGKPSGRPSSRLEPREKQEIVTFMHRQDISRNPMVIGRLQSPVNFPDRIHTQESGEDPTSSPAFSLTPYDSRSSFSHRGTPSAAPVQYSFCSQNYQPGIHVGERFAPSSIANGHHGHLLSSDSAFSEQPHIPREMYTSRSSSRHLQYANEDVRRETFETWPNTSPISPRELVTAGFFYTGRDDLVRCFDCGVGIENWVPSDRPLEEHRKFSPSCSFIQNVVLPEVPFMNGGFAEPTQTHNNQLHAPGLALGDVKHPDYYQEHVRVSSFMGWPETHTQTPPQLANAGFFYSGCADIVRCFACDGGIQKWEPNEDPWLEHARWFPRCPYLLLVKGSDYLELVQSSVQQTASEEPERRELMTNGRSPVSYRGNLMMEKDLDTQAARGTIELGFSREAVRVVIREHRAAGNGSFTLEDLVQILLDKQERGEVLPTDSPIRLATPVQSDDPKAVLAENQKLKSMVVCMLCNTNHINVLCLPCTHHCMCQGCAQGLTHCPKCNRYVQEMVRTYMS